jgi:hypothetical protein
MIFHQTSVDVLPSPRQYITNDKQATNYTARSVESVNGDQGDKGACHA